MVRRHGGRPEARPSRAPAPIYQLTGAEAADLLAYVRSFKVERVGQPRMQARPLVRVGVLTGKLKSEPATLKARADVVLAEAR